MNNIKNWHVLYTKANSEKKVSDLLTRKKIKNYYPINRVVKQWNGKNKESEQPLFPSYVFVYASTEELTVIKQMDNVINFVYWLGKPAVIHETEIAVIKNFSSSYYNIAVEKISVNLSEFNFLNINSYYVFDKGVMQGTSKLVKGMLPSLGYSMVAEFNPERAEFLKRDVLLTNSNVHSNNIHHGLFR